jgi:hypothetical protein
VTGKIAGVVRGQAAGDSVRFDVHVALGTASDEPFSGWAHAAMPLIEPKCLVLADNIQPIGRLLDVSNASCKNTNCDATSLVKIHSSQQLAVVVPTG